MPPPQAALSRPALKDEKEFRAVEDRCSNPSPDGEALKEKAPRKGALGSFILFSFLGCISSFYPLLVPLI
jgi:hypothetical protein